MNNKNTNQNNSQKIDKVAMVSEDIESENLQKLRAVFPQFVKDGFIDFDALQAFLKKEGVLTGVEKYGLSWAGKSKAFSDIRRPATGTLTPQPDESKNWDSTENIFIEGENLEVLKLLQKHYANPGRIKIIYLDPPYNTGKDFVYKDNFTQDISDYYEQTGQTQGGIKMTANTETNGRFHSDWLTMMYSRLFLARNLLTDDGVIFISIDDNEVANLRMIMDEIFGEENFVVQIEWQKRYTRSNNTDNFTTVIEHILVYRKSNLFKPNLLTRNEEADERYTNTDNDPRGPWKAMPFFSQATPIQRPNLCYEIVNPNNGKVVVPKRKAWRSTKEVFEEYKNNNQVYWGKDGKSEFPSIKKFLNEARDGMTPINFWDHKFAGNTDDANYEIKDLFGERVFDTPKPVLLIKRMLELSTEIDQNDIILDFFAGSGTTAHAVMDLNAGDNGNRKYICVQMPELTEKNSEAYKEGYKTIAEICKERIRRAGDKYTYNYEHINNDSKKVVLEVNYDNLDVGFKAYKLSSSNYRRWNTLTSEDNEKALLQQAKLFTEKPLIDKYDDQSIIYEVLLKEGFDLNSKVIEVKNSGIIYYQIIDGQKEMTITFASKIMKEQIESISLSKDTTFVCFDSALDDTTKVNIMRNLTLKTI